MSCECCRKSASDLELYKDKVLRALDQMQKMIIKKDIEFPPDQLKTIRDACFENEEVSKAALTRIIRTQKTISTKCKHCGGSGSLGGHWCYHCEGSGENREKDEPTHPAS